MNAAEAYCADDDLKEKGWRTIEQDMSNPLYEYTAVFGGRRRIPIRTFSSADVTITSDRPVEMILSVDEDCFLAENQALHIVAAGHSIDEAAGSFIEQVIHFYTYYSALSPDEVTGSARRIRDLFVNHFRELNPFHAV